MSDPVKVVLPPVLARLDGSIDGLTDVGELIVAQSHPNGPADTLSVLDLPTGAIQLVVSRKPVTYAKATSQIGGATGNADWIVWVEAGFTLEVGDWTMWAMDRHTGKIRKIAGFEPGTNGQAVPGWASNVSILGDLAAWSADIEAPGRKIEPRVYVADLRAGTVRRLDPTAKWPSLVSRDELVAAVAVGNDADGKAIAQPATISLADGSVRVQDWIPPARLLAHATGQAGTVVVRMAKPAAAEEPSVIAEVVTHRVDGAIRTFALRNDWGAVAAGPGFLAWLDQQHLWVLATGQVDPAMLAETPGDWIGVAMIANGSTIYWWTGAGSPVTGVLANVTCH